ncbi:MAG: uracil-DNA glycosylase [Bacteroidetes bacterium]|nr:uracil-DNA glycosylase [Bacteroidota bacterium]
MDVTFHSSWKEILNDEFTKPYFIQLTVGLKRLYSEKKGIIFPKSNQIFRAFDLCPFDELKVVILGQDPYPTRGHAHGLSFSVEPYVRPFPKSLTNIFKEIQSDLGKSFPSNGNLERWAKQGVLLLNTVLTVEEGKPDSHNGLGWENFTDAVIQKINSEKEGVVFMLWGSKAIVKEFMIDKSKHLILKSVHPSPLSAYRGFFGCKHFSKSNEFLLMLEKPEIDW